MTTQDILRSRFTNQQLVKTTFSTPAEMVAWFGAMQSQDYSGAKWAVGQRLPKATDETLEDAFTEGFILRTHVMRPTWHFVAPKDIRWMLKLTGFRVKRFMSSYNKLLELDDHVFAKAHKAIAKALRGKKQLTRQELKVELTRIGVQTNIQRLAHIVMQAELDGLICSGPRKGLQFTYMFFEERVPKTKSLDQDEALAELTKRYFQSHGPATIKDFVWWSGLTTVDARKGIDMVKTKIRSETIENKTYWFSPTSSLPIPKDIFLLPNYDEYGIAYTEREAFFNPEYNKLLDSRGNATFQHLIVFEGKMIGTWKRTLNKDAAILETLFFTKPTDRQYQAFKSAAERYGKFLDLSVRLS